MTLPHLSGSSLKNAVRNQLVGLFPGDLDSQIIKIRKNKGEKNNYLVFVLPGEKPKGPVAVSTLFIQRRFPGKNAKVLFVDDSSLEFVLLHEGTVVKSRVKNRGNPIPPETITGIIGSGYSPGDNTIEVFCRNEDRSFFQDNKEFSFVFHDLENELLKTDVNKISLFNYLGPEYKRKGVLLSLLAASLLIAILCLSYEYKNSQAEYRRNIRTEQENLRKIKDAEEQEKKYLAELKMKYSRLADEKKVTPYEIIEIIAAALAPDTRIINQTIKENFFQFEALSPDALLVLNSFENNSQINNPMIQQIRPSGAFERFVISGTVSPKIDPVNQDTPIRDQIVELENFVENLENNSYGKNVYSPSLFGVNIRSLLKKWDCTINSYQFFNSETGKEVEFSIRTKSASFFGFLQEAVLLDNGWYFNLIQIRNLSPLNAIDVVFRVAGNISTENNPDMELTDETGIAFPLPIPAITKNYYSLQPPPRPVQAAPVPPQAPPPGYSNAPEKVSWLEFVGAVGDNSGNNFIYVKDTRIGKVIKLIQSPEGNLRYLDLNNGAFHCFIDGKTYELWRK
jgi:hypothetical protein